ncbi:MAG: SRPBCC family protein [Verrucomicrobiota bacterium]
MPPPTPAESPISERELVLVRETDVPPEKLYAGWTTPGLYPQWFCPKPWYVKDVEMDLRAGGYSKMTMCGPNGESFPNEGVYLEIVPNKKIVFTDAYKANWEPNPNLFFTGIVTFEVLPSCKTRYTARAVHWTQEACEKHAAMGFKDGWSAAFDQLVALMSE